MKEVKIMVREVTKVNRWGNVHGNFDVVKEISVFQGDDLVAYCGDHKATDKGIRKPFETVFDSRKVSDLKNYYNRLGRSKSDTWLKEAIRGLDIKGLDLAK